jgi:hypothetical protein
MVSYAGDTVDPKFPVGPVYPLGDLIRYLLSTSAMEDVYDY